MDPYHRYLEYQRQTKDMYKLLRNRIYIYNQQQHLSSLPHFTINIRHSHQPQTRHRIKVTDYTTIKQVKTMLNEITITSTKDSLMRGTPHGQETLQNWLCMTDYNIGDGEELYLIVGSNENK